MRYENKPRGQAVFETAIMMPLFLFGLFGIMYAVRQSAVAERVQLGVRYGGLVTSKQDPFRSYSLYSVYTTIDSTSPVVLGTKTCPEADQTQTTTNRAVFWQPLGAPTFDCKSAVSVIKTTQGTSQNVLLQSDWIKLGAMTPVGGYLSARTFKGGTGTQSVITAIAAENFFRSPDIGQLLQCGPLGNAVKASLEGADSANASNVAPTAMPLVIAASPIIAVPLNCPTFGPPPTTTTSTSAPTPPNVPTTPPPTPTPIVTIPPVTPPPTPTPIKTPAPPTAIPTIAPATPVPTPTPNPTPTPIPTPTPSPSPTPNPYGTLPPGASS